MVNDTQHNSNDEDKLNDEELIIEFDDVDESPDEDESDALVVELDDDDDFTDPDRTDSIDLTISELPDDIERQAQQDVPVPGKKMMPAVDSISGTPLLIMAVGGLTGGFIGWIFSEICQPIFEIIFESSHILKVGFWAGVVGGAIGISIVFASMYKSGVTFHKAQNWLAFGLAFGVVGGLVGGGLAQAMYGNMTMYFSLGVFSQLVLRAVAWSIFGVFVGMGQAAFQVSPEKMRNGIIGGALGGFIGGVAFEFIAGSETTAILARMIALCILGLAIGLMISLVEEVAKVAWLKVIEGALSGKEFILYDERTVIGGSPKCDIHLFKDSSVAPEHAEIINERTQFTIRAIEPQAQIKINDRPVTDHILTDREIIIIGKSRFLFRERAEK